MSTFNNSNNRFAGSTWEEVQMRALEQVLEENKQRVLKQNQKLVVNQRVKSIMDRAQAMGESIRNFDPNAYLDRKMLGFGLDPAQTKFPEYDYIDKKNSIPAEKFEETYPPNFLALLANAWEYDLNIMKAMELKANLITANGGEGITFTLKAHTYKEVKNPEELDKLMDNFIEKGSRDSLTDYIDNVLAYTRLYANMEDPVMQKMIFGRGGALVRRVNKSKLEADSILSKLGFIEGSPVAINPLSTIAMGRVLVDPTSWRVTDLWYSDAIFGKDENNQDIPADWIPARDMIYLVNKNYHMLPNRLHYGFSEIVPSLPISETIRQIYSEILTEANINLVLPSLMFTFEGLDQATMQEYVDNYRGGGIMGRNSNVGMDKVEFSPNLDQILNELNHLEKTINYASGVPPIFTTKQELTNRSVADRIAEVWTLTDLVPLQQKFSVALYDQFFTPVITHWLEMEVGEDASKNFMAAKMRVVTNFPKLSFEDMLQKAQTLDYYKKNFIISIAEWRKMINMEPFPEDQIQLFDKLQRKLQDNPDLLDAISAAIDAAGRPPVQPGDGGMLQDPDAFDQTIRENQQANDQMNQMMDQANNNLKKRIVDNRF